MAACVASTEIFIVGAAAAQLIPTKQDKQLIAKFCESSFMRSPCLCEGMNLTPSAEA